MKRMMAAILAVLCSFVLLERSGVFAAEEPEIASAAYVLMEAETGAGAAGVHS